MINAFHPAYIQTHMPEFLSIIRKESGQKANGEKFGAKSRATRESDESQLLSSITLFPKTKAKK